MDSKIEFNALCRLCLAKNHVNIHIFEGEGCKEGIFLKISTCLPVNVSFDDKLPKRICTNCLNKLNILYQFCNKSANSEKQLLEWFNQCTTEKDSETLTDNVDTEMLHDDSEIEVKEEKVSLLTEEDDNYNIKVEEVDVEDNNMLQDIPHHITDTSHEECSDIIDFNAATNGTVDDEDGRSITPNPLRTEINSRYTKMPSRRKSKNQQVMVNHKSKRKFFKYTEEDLAMALLEIRQGRKSIREASKKFGVPKTTIQDRLKGRAPEKIGKTGPEPILTIQGEKRIADWVVAIAKRGFHIQKRYLIETVQKIVKDSDKTNTLLKNEKIFKNGKPGRKWYVNFLKRNPEISMLENEGVNKTQAVVAESIGLWFSDLRKFLEENNLMDVFDDPDRILNGDEFGLSLCPKTGEVLGPKEYRVKMDSENENITVLVVFTASGKICPPLVVFPYVRSTKGAVESMPESCVLSKSDSGEMEADLFYDYVANDLNNWLTKNFIKKPVILFIDGHRSHMTLPLSEVCEKNEIILYALPSNFIHMLQPADVSVFQPFKQGWKDTIQKWQSKPENINSLIMKTNICRFIEEVLADSDMTNAIKNGFLKCGLFPLAPNNIDYTNCAKNKYIGKTKLAEPTSTC